MAERTGSRFAMVLLCAFAAALDYGESEYVYMTQLTKKQPKNRKERAVRRCPVVASVEVTEHSSGTRLSGRISELAMGGCYVDSLNPFPVDAVVQVKIVRDQGAFEAEARVAYCDPRFGMGLAFTQMTPEHRAVLEGWLFELVMLLKPEP
jgi:hypothetical protein